MVYQLSGKSLRLVILITAANAFLLFGYDQGVCGSLVELPQFLATFNHPSATMLGFMVAAYNIGCLSGAIVAAFIGDKLGRKRGLLYGCIVLCIGATLQTSAFTRTQWIVGRIVAGLGTGSIGTTVPVYIAETSEAAVRGKMVVLEIAIIIGGIVVSNWTNYGFIFHAPNLEGSGAQWRIPIGLQMMFPLMVFVTLPFCVESPRWLALVGRYDEVAPALRRLRGSSTDDNAEVDKISEQVVLVARHEVEIEGTWVELFRNGELQNCRRMIICALAGFFQQATGINVVVYYAPRIFANVGIAGESAFILSGANSICFLAGAILPIFYIERIGRRRTMLIGSTAVGLCMLGVAASVAISTQYPEKATAGGYAGAFFLFLYVFVFGMSWCSLCWLYASETASLRLRNKGSALQSVLNWTTCFLTVMTTPVGIEKIGWRLYLVWAIVTLGGVPVIYFTFPETAGRTLEQMDAFYAKYRSWNIRKVAYEWIPVEIEGTAAPTEEDSEKGIEAEKAVDTVHRETALV